ncbi:7869_t:CDS:1, partial [Cetraspora pellucida]
EPTETVRTKSQERQETLILVNQDNPQTIHKTQTKYSTPSFAFYLELIIGFTALYLVEFLKPEH